ncbi:MAG TPA: menaquinone biosynthesis protein [Terriglobales bacterium]|nr:menaquinone biosynthesis protein [Terriglobales bacterium]
MRPVRVSAISFLNTAPLLWDFEHGAPRPEFRLEYTVPSACAEQLRAGAADVGIIPVAAYHAIPDLVIIPEVAIATKRTVRSIVLVSKVPMEEIRTVAADTSSRTSVLLARLLFRKWHGGDREFLPMAPDLGTMLARCDAALLIGDPALTISRSQYLIYDLAEEWHRLTAKPFVFAFWAVRREALAQAPLDLARTFQQSRDHGLQPANLQQLGREWAPRVSLSEVKVVSYLTQNIDYSLDAENLAGMELFFRYAAEAELLPQSRPVEFLAARAGAGTRGQEPQVSV